VIGAQSSSPQDRPIATAGGAVIGAVIGGAIGRAMDRSDHGCAYQALEYAQLNQTVVWSNPAIGASYTMTPLESYRVPGGGDCRRFVVRSTRNGRPLEETGRACRQGDGRWQPA
jgi:surface antigen